MIREWFESHVPTVLVLVRDHRKLLMMSGKGELMLLIRSLHDLMTKVAFVAFPDRDSFFIFSQHLRADTAGECTVPCPFPTLHTKAKR